MLGLSGFNKSDSTKGRRILFVADHYWPYTSDSTLRLKSQLRLWNEHGWRTTLITPRWHRSWASCVTVENTSVIRLEHPPSDLLSSGRYRKSVSQWLSQNLSNFDAVWCDDSLGKAAPSVAVAARSLGKPWVVRFDPDGSDPKNSAGSLKRPSDITMQLCGQANAVVVSTAAAHQCLVQHGLSGRNIVRSSDWRVASLDRSSSARIAARQALGAICGDLALKAQEQLILVPGDLSERWAISLVLDAVAPLLERHPNLHLWMHGDGPGRELYYDRLKELGLHRIALMPGVFSCIEPLLQAADLCLFPAADCGKFWLLPTCLVSDIPSLMAQSVGLEPLLKEGWSTLTFRPGSYQDLHAKIESWLRKPADLIQATRQAREAIRRSEQASPVASNSEASRAFCDWGQTREVEWLWNKFQL